MSKAREISELGDKVTVSGNNVGIGTSSPTSTYATSLHVNTSGNNSGIRLTAGTSTAGFDLVADSAAAYVYNRDNTPLIFATNNTQRMRIDASGNLLVGLAAPQVTGTAAGFQVDDGAMGATAVSAASGYFSRKTTDGDIVVFRKDTTTVGSIGTREGDVAIGTGDTGLIFNAAGDTILPFNMSTNAGRDAALDLGISAFRFKNLYLSGSIYQGYSASGYIPLTTVRHCDNGGGGVIFPTHVANKAQMGTLYAYDTSNNNWCVYALKKNDGGSTISVQLLAGTGLTIVATNSFGTIAMSNDTSAVKMIVQIYVVEN